MATLPFLLQEFDLVQGCTDTTDVHQRAVQLYYRLRATDRALRQWYTSLSIKIPKPLPSEIRIPEKGLVNSDDDRFFSFQESDYALAALLALYWATCNLLHSLCRMVYAHFHSSGLSEFSQELPEHIDPLRSATSIARSVGYFLRPEMGILGPQLISFPMGVALVHLMACKDPNAKEEHQKLSAIMWRFSEVAPSLGTFMSSLRAVGHSNLPSNPSEDTWRGSTKMWFEGCVRA